MTADMLKLNPATILKLPVTVSCFQNSHLVCSGFETRLNILLLQWVCTLLYVGLQFNSICACVVIVSSDADCTG